MACTVQMIVACNHTEKERREREGESDGGREREEVSKTHRLDLVACYQVSV